MRRWFNARHLKLVAAMGLAGWGCGDDLRPIDNPDAATPDAATPDAATPDAAMPDAATPDAATRPEPTVFADCLEGELCVVFPPPMSITDSGTITVRGTADPQTGAVWVAGIAATTSDGFATWRATVPLSPGVNSLLVERDDALGALVPRAVSFTVTSQPVAERAIPPENLVVDPVGDRIVVLSNWRKIAVVDLATGVERLVSDQLPPEIVGLAVDPSRDRALFTVYRDAALYSVDLSTGVIAVVSDATTGTGPAPVISTLVEVDTAGDRALVWDGGLDALVAVDLARGDRTIVADATVGMGPVPAGGYMDLDDATGRVLVTDRVLDALLWVDLATGDRTIAAPLDPDDGLFDPWLDVWGDIQFGSIAVMPGQDRAVVLASASNEWEDWVSFVLVYDLVTGTRTLLSPAPGMPGVEIISPSAVAFDPARDLVLLAEGWHDSIVAMDPVSAEPTVPWARDGGPLLVDPRDVVWDAAGDRLLVSDIGWRGIVEVRRENGEQVVLTKPGVQIPARMHAGDMMWDRTRNLVYVADVNVGHDWYRANMVVHDLDARISTFARVPWLAYLEDMALLDGVRNKMVTLEVHVDGCALNSILIRGMTNRTRTWVSQTEDCGSPSPSLGSGPLFGRPRSLALDLFWSRVLVMDQERGLMGVDLATGDRTVLSDAATGTGPVWVAPHSVALDQVRGRALVVDNGLQALISVDLATGDRTVVSDAVTGTGPSIMGSALALDPDHGLAFIVDSLRQALLAVDLETGERVVWWGTSAAPAP